MSQTSDDAKKPARAAVNLGKAGAGATGGVRPAVSIAVPRTINLACVALSGIVLGMAVRAIGVSGSTPTMKKYLIVANSKAKTPKTNYDPTQDLHNFRQGATVNLLLLAVIAALLIWAMRRPRSASASRWVLLIVMVFMELPLLIIPKFGYPSGLPPLARLGGALAGVFAVATIALVFVPRESQQYFRACRDATLPPGAQRRPGLFGQGLFGPRAPRRGTDTATRPAATRPADTRPAPASASTRPAAPRAKAKGRSDADAVAKGAELARSRAKASKSRRSGG